VSDLSFVVKNYLAVNSNAFVANGSGAYSTGVVNAAALQVGSSVIANSSGVYTTGVVNAASYTVGTTFTANSILVNAYAISTQTNTVTIGTAAYHAANGNLGLGTATPAYTLDVAGNGRFGNNIWLSYPSSNPWRVTNLSGNFYINYNNTTDFVQINSSNSSINFPQAVVFSSTVTANASVGSTGQVLTSNGTGVYWATPVTTQISSLGVGTPASGTTGEIRATNNITAFYSSDESLKENVSVIPNALDKVKAIRGVEFDWTDKFIANNGGEDGYFVRKHDVGVIAQEIEKVLPEVVATREDGTKAVKYDRVVALLIEAIKELEAKVNSGAN